MPQVRIYENGAQRQAAFRRRRSLSLAAQAELARLTRSLHGVIQTAVLYGAFPLPEEIAAARPEQTMRKLIDFFDSTQGPGCNRDSKRKRSGLLHADEASYRGR